MRRIGCSSNKSGFSLIEALISSVVMVIGLFAVATAIYAQFSSLSENREKTIATLAVQEEIENLRGMRFSDILALGSSSTFSASGFVYLNNPSGTVIIDNTYSPISGEDNIRRITVAVEWDSVSGKTLQEIMVTLMTNGGINKQ